MVLHYAFRGRRTCPLPCERGISVQSMKLLKRTDLHELLRGARLSGRVPRIGDDVQFDFGPDLHNNQQMIDFDEATRLIAFFNA